jgi:hypothetical protein
MFSMTGGNLSQFGVGNASTADEHAQTEGNSEIEMVVRPVGWTHFAFKMESPDAYGQSDW